MGKQKGKTKKNAGKSNIEEELKDSPHSFVFNRGKVGANVSELVRDLRRVMEPFTASHLKPHRKNVLKDFLSVAGPLNVSHFLMFSKNEEHINLKIIRSPRGPTLTFQIVEYSLARDVVASQRRPHMESKQFLHHPLLVMNNLSGEGVHLRLMATMFQNMFPSINVNKVKLANIKRCVLINCDSETKLLTFRHYNIRAVPVGMSRSVRKLLKAKIPNLAKYDDVSDFITRGDVSESEAEMDGEHNEVVLPQKMPGRGNIKSCKSAVRLCEIGPRITMRLVKIEEGVAEGNVLYHEFVHKSEEELAEQNRKRKKKMQLKADRKKRQEANVAQKAQQREQHKLRSRQGMAKASEGDKTQEPQAGSEAQVSEDDDDREYFKQEVGEEPDAELFPERKKQHKKRKLPQNFKKTDKNKVAKMAQSTRGSSQNRSKGGQRDSAQRGKGQVGGGKKGQWQKKSDKADDKGKSSEKDFRQKKQPLTEMDKMRRSKARKVQRTEAKVRGKRANKPRKS